MLTKDSPYSRENFQWLMENTSAKNWLGDDNLQRIAAAIQSDDREYLQTMYGIMLGQYLKEQDINQNFAENHVATMEKFRKDVQQMENAEKILVKAQHDDIEIGEKKGAEDILKQLDE